MQALVWIALATGLFGPTHAAPFVAAGPAPVLAIRPADSTVPPAPVAGPALPAFVAGVAQGPFLADASDAAAPQRPRAIEYPSGYYTRLAIHKYASYATLPLFVAEYFIGRSLYNNPTTSSRSLRSAHTTVAEGLGALFAINTVTGVWNMWDSRQDPAGRVRRYLHGGLMLLADAGFVATAAMTPHRRDFRGTTTGTPNPAAANLHRGLAISSMGVALGSYVMMLLWRR
jgi:hypothetical protein